MTAQTSALFAGLDVSLAETHVCVLDGDGVRVLEAVVASDPDAIATAPAEGAPDCASIAVETGATTPWLWRELRARGVPVTCIDARHANRALSMRRNKTDRNDARGLAELMRIGWYEKARVRDLDAQLIRSMLNARYQLRMCRRDLLNQLRGIVKTFGLYIGSTASRRFPEIVREIAAEDAKAATMLMPLVNALDAIRDQIAAYEAELRAIARGSDTARRLMTVPGVGYLVSPAFISAIDDPMRFSSSAKVGPYLGLTPRIRQSGEADWSVGIGRAPDRLMRSYLYEAANIVLTRTTRWPRLKAWGVRLHKRVGFKRAAIGVARKLAVIMHAIWVDGTESVHGAEPAAR